MSSQTGFRYAVPSPHRFGSVHALRTLGRWLHLPALMLATTGVSLFLSVQITRLLLSFLHASGRLVWASHIISASVPLMVAPAATWLVGGLIVRAEAGRRRSERLATVDPLTGILNRRHFFALAGAILGRSIHIGRRVAVLLLDVDHFKRINDTCGHATGDVVLKTLAECCLQHLREYDLIARLGGEEFVVLLDDITDDGEAQRRAEHLRLVIAAQSIAAGEARTVRPTVSVGVAVSDGKSITLDGLLEVADRAMYAAKQGGRNRTCFGPNCKAITPSAGTETPDTNLSISPRFAPSQTRRPRLLFSPAASADVSGEEPAPYAFDSAMLARLSETISQLGVRNTILWVTGISIIASVACGLLTLVWWHAVLRECVMLVGMCLVVPSIVVPLPVWVVATRCVEAEAAQRSAERLAAIDPLTGLYNRRHFLGLAEQRLEQARHTPGSLTVLLFDIDHFKSINDNHGHATGDKVLAQVAQVALGCLREDDILGRFGGEEFVALLPGTSIAAAELLAERLRTAVAEIAIETPHRKPIRATLSIGACEITSGDMRIDVLIDRADKAMYRAKRTGRNRVCIAA